MAIFHEGYKDIKVKLLSWEGNNFAKRVYEFGHLSHDIYEGLPEEYDAENPKCKMLLDKIIGGTTLPKFALQGTRIEFEIDGISRICLAQITRDPAFFASASTGVFPLTQEFNMPLSIIQYDDIMDKVKQAQYLLEEAYIMACEREIPSIEARYIGLHPQIISLTASYTPADFVRACYSRTNSNFCDECNYVYRKMYDAIRIAIADLTDVHSQRLWQWILNEYTCINDKTYRREHLYNSDFLPDADYVADRSAINDWRKSGWKMELERMYAEEWWLLTANEIRQINNWKEHSNLLHTTYDTNAKDNLKNAIKNTHYYKEHRHD